MMSANVGRLVVLQKSKLPFLREYIQEFARFRASFLGYLNESEVNLDYLYSIIDDIRESDGELGGIVVLPNPFEEARSLLLELEEEEDFKVILKGR